MKNRPAFDCSRLLLGYNAFQVVLSTHLFILSLRAGWGGDYSFTCQPVDLSPKGDLMLQFAWICHLSKYIDFIDTFFFVARKKFSQVTVLHVYHHASMPFSVWIAHRFEPGGHVSFCTFVNAFVHIVMYTYYLLAGLGPRFQKFLWWKPYVTRLQLAQFVLVLLHAGQLLVYPDCDVNFLFIYLLFGQAIVFLALFSNFYAKAYLAKKKLN
jgi:hypothetical protein